LNTPKLLGTFVACLLGGAIIWGFVTRSITTGVVGFAAVLFASYFLLKQFNAYERSDIDQKKKRRDRGDR